MLAERAEIVDEAAADWIARRDRGPWSAADQTAFERWLGAAVEHKVAWLRLNAAWEKADGLRVGKAATRAVPSWFRRPRIAAAAIAATLAAGVFVALQFAPDAYATNIGGARAEVLDDGARLELNTDTRLTVRRDGEIRRVKLDRGEAYFTIPGGGPFVVEAGDYRVTARGGAFSVHRQDDRLLVAVERGQVVVSRRDLPAEPVICTAGSMVEARPEATRLVTEPSRLERLLSWRRGLVTFEDSRLSEVAAEFNRYNRTKLVIVDPALAEARVGGAFRPTNLDAFIRILGQDLGVSARRDDGRILLGTQDDEK